MALVVAATIAATPAQAAGDWGPDTCLEGYVWRDAVPGDHVCVTPDVRAQALLDNGEADARRSPTGGPYGPDTCLDGYVWREAAAGDHVCVTPATRAQAAADNQRGDARRNSLRLWHMTYTTGDACHGDICELTSTADIPRFRLFADHVNVGWATVELRRLNNDALTRRWVAYAGPSWYGPGGHLTLDTNEFDCRRAADSYFQIRDPASGRVSARELVSSICYVL